MSRKLLTGNAAAAWGARLASVDYIPAFPITPQTEIIETLSGWVDHGEMSARQVMLESEHSMITAAGAACATGVRVFSATSSQGLLYGMEMLYNVAGWRTPFVLVNVSRGLSAPITLEPDHNDVLAARDSGCLQIHCSTCQEVLDSVLMAYRLGEHADVRLPVIVNMDGFYLSFTREPVDLPDPELAQNFVGEYHPDNLEFRASAPLSHAVAVLGSAPYSYFRYEMHLAAQKALDVFDEVATEFGSIFERQYEAVEAYRMEDAKYVFVMMGSFATKAKEAVDRLRDAGWPIGLLRPRLFRPFPELVFYQQLKGKAAVAVIDQNLSMGKGGILHSELCSALYGKQDVPPILASFVGGLGGRDFTAQEFYEIAKVLQEAEKQGVTPPPRLMYTETEYRQVKNLQSIAHVERQELGEDK
jgi:pyruvate ferredoxin oxidoreductase alpha subunit